MPKTVRSAIWKTSKNWYVQIADLNVSPCKYDFVGLGVEIEVRGGARGGACFSPAAGTWGSIINSPGDVWWRLEQSLAENKFWCILSLRNTSEAKLLCICRWVRDVDKAVLSLSSSVNSRFTGYLWVTSCFKKLVISVWICVDVLGAVLKVLSMEENRFSEVCNLRIREMVNLSYSATDVAWSPLEGLSVCLYVISATASSM